MNRKLLIVDGSPQELLNEENLKEVYVAVQTRREVVPVMAQSSAIYDCLNHMMIYFQTAPNVKIFVLYTNHGKTIFMFEIFEGNDAERT